MGHFPAGLCGNARGPSWLTPCPPSASVLRLLLAPLLPARTSRTLSIGVNAFLGCSSLISGRIPGSVGQHPSRCVLGLLLPLQRGRPGHLHHIGRNAFQFCSPLPSVASLTTSPSSATARSPAGCAPWQWAWSYSGSISGTRKAGPRHPGDSGPPPPLPRSRELPRCIFRPIGAPLLAVSTYHIRFGVPLSSGGRKPMDLLVHHGALCELNQPAPARPSGPQGSPEAWRPTTTTWAAWVGCGHPHMTSQSRYRPDPPVFQTRTRLVC